MNSIFIRSLIQIERTHKTITAKEIWLFHVCELFILHTPDTLWFQVLYPPSWRHIDWLANAYFLAKQQRANDANGSKPSERGSRSGTSKRKKDKLHIRRLFGELDTFARSLTLSLSRNGWTIFRHTRMPPKAIWFCSVLSGHSRSVLLT